MRWNSYRLTEEPPHGESVLLDESDCHADPPARIKGLMRASIYTPVIPRQLRLPLIRRDHARRLVRAPGQLGSLSPEEVAYSLKSQRAELRRRLDWRADAAGIPADVREEIVDDAIHLVVMSSKPIRDEQHVQGAFWQSIGYLLLEHKTGRHRLRVGLERSESRAGLSSLLLQRGLRARQLHPRRHIEVYLQRRIARLRTPHRPYVRRQKPPRLTDRQNSHLPRR